MPAQANVAIAEHAINEGTCKGCDTQYVANQRTVLLENQRIRVDVITKEHRLIVTYVPKELLRAGALIKSRIVDEIDGTSLSSGHTDLEIGSSGRLDVTKLFVHGLQECYEVCLVCGFVEAVIGSCIYRLILLSVQLSMKLFNAFGGVLNILS